MAGKAACSSPQVGTVWPMLQWRLFSALRFCPTWFQGKVLEMLTGTGSNFIYPTCVWRPWICVVWPWWIWECHDGMRLEFQSRWSQHFHLDVYSTSNAIPVVSSTSFWGFKPICTCAPLARSMWVGGWSHCYKKNAAQLNRLQGWLFRGDTIATADTLCVASSVDVCVSHAFQESS